MSGQADVAELARLVKAEFSYDTDLKDEDFQAQVKVALDEIAAMKKDDPKATKKAFWQFMDHYADASYYDRMSDLERLVHLVTRRTELLVDRKKMYLSKIDDASFRCAKMMQNLYLKNNIRVYPAKAQLYIKETLKLLVNRAFSGQPGNKTAAFATALADRLDAERAGQPILSDRASDGGGESAPPLDPDGFLTV